MRRPRRWPGRSAPARAPRSTSTRAPRAPGHGRRMPWTKPSWSPVTRVPPTMAGRGVGVGEGVLHRALAGARRPGGRRSSRPSGGEDPGAVAGRVTPAFSTRTFRAVCQWTWPSARLTRQTVPCSLVSSAVPSPRTTAAGYMVLPGNVQRTAPVAASSASDRRPWPRRPRRRRARRRCPSRCTGPPGAGRPRPSGATSFPPGGQVVRAGVAVRGRGIDPLAVARGPPGGEPAAGHGPGELPGGRVHREQLASGGEHHVFVPAARRPRAG